LVIDKSYRTDFLSALKLVTYLEKKWEYMVKKMTRKSLRLNWVHKSHEEKWDFLPFHCLQNTAGPGV
jgi:hypothetical protein